MPNNPAGVPREDSAIVCTGWICGNNYRRRGRIIEAKGVPQGEPWYEADDGTMWSSFDVRFVPDAIPSPDERQPDAAPAPELVCAKCGSPAEFIVSEGLYRHKGEPHENFGQTFCDRYGYPIPVKAAKQPDPPVTAQELRGLARDYDLRAGYAEIQSVKPILRETAEKLRKLADWMERRK